MTARTSPAALVLLWQSDLLLAVSRKGFPSDLGLPGGKVEEGERPKEAALRELYEETGVLPYDLRVTTDPVFEDSDGTPSGRHVYVYEAYATSGQTLVIHPEKYVTVRWVKPETLLHERNTFHRFNRRLFAALGVI